MSKKTIILATVLLLAVAAAAYFHFAGKEYVVRISEKQIQEKLAEKLPMTKSYFFILEVTLDNPRVVLQNGSRRVAAGLDVTLNININKNPKPLGGSLDVSGGVRYVADQGSFYLEDPQIENLAVQGVPAKYIKKINKALTKALAEYYKNNPIYTLSNFNAKQAMARLVLKDVVVENSELVITLGI